MQSGKTDVMKRLIYIVNNNNDQLKKLNINIDKYNIYVVICASSINLKTQLQQKLSEIKHKIYHLNDINTMVKNPSEYESIFITMADSSLIIFDECHCDAECLKIIDRFRTILKKHLKIILLIIIVLDFQRHHMNK
nr:DEAD helicase [Mimivirus sp.]